MWKYLGNRAGLILRRMGGIGQPERIRACMRRETWSAASWKLSREKKKRRWIASTAVFLAIFVFIRFWGSFLYLCSQLEPPRISTPKTSATVANTNTFFPLKRSLPSNPLLRNRFVRTFARTGRNTSRTKPIYRNAESTPTTRSKTLLRTVPTTNSAWNPCKQRSNCCSTRLLSPATPKTRRTAALEGVSRKRSGRPISLWRSLGCELACRCLWEPTISTTTPWASRAPILLRRDTFWGFRWATPSEFTIACTFVCAWRDRASCCTRFEKWSESRSRWREAVAHSTQWTVAWAEETCSLRWLQALDSFCPWYSSHLFLWAVAHICGIQQETDWQNSSDRFQ